MSLKGLSIGFLGAFLALIVFFVTLVFGFPSTCSSVMLEYEGSFDFSFHPTTNFTGPMRNSFAQVAGLDLSTQRAVVDKVLPMDSSCGPSDSSACSKGIQVYISTSIDSTTLNSKTLSKDVRDDFLEATYFPGEPWPLNVSLQPAQLTGVTVGEDNEACGSQGIRVVALITAMWVVGFSVVTLLYLNQRPGPPVPAGEHYYSIGIHTMKHTFTHWKEHKQLFLFLGAYFVFSDGISTATGAAAQFGATELNMAQDETLILRVQLPSCAAGGARARARARRTPALLSC